MIERLLEGLIEHGPIGAVCGILLVIVWWFMRELLAELRAIRVTLTGKLDAIETHEAGVAKDLLEIKSGVRRLEAR